VFSPDGRFVVTSSDDGVRVFDAGSGRCLRRLRQFPGGSVVCDGEGNVLSVRGEAWRYVYGLLDRPGQPPLVVDPGPLPMEADVSLLG